MQDCKVEALCKGGKVWSSWLLLVRTHPLPHLHLSQLQGMPCLGQQPLGCTGCGTALEKQLLPQQAPQLARLLLTSHAHSKVAGEGKSSELQVAWAETVGAGG